MDTPFDLLQRTDKHYLGAGDGTLFAPPHPLWLDRPGFWDGGHVFLYGLTPLFTLSLVAQDGTEVRLRPGRREWTPARIVMRYEADALEIEEHRAVLPAGRFTSALRITNNGEEPTTVYTVAWTAQEGAGLVERAVCSAGSEGIAFRVAARDAQDRSGRIDLDCTLRFTDEPAEDWAVNESQQSARFPNTPNWEATPFRDRWDAERPSLQGFDLADSPVQTGRTLVYAGLSRGHVLKPGASAWVAVELQVLPNESLRWRSAAAGNGLLGNGAAAEAVSGTATQRRFAAAEASRDAWLSYYDAAPSLDTSDPWLGHYFAYRWYGLRLNFIEPAGNYSHPTCTEGIEFFHCPISYSAWCHMRELRWLANPARARGALLTFLEHQREDGALPGRVYLDHDRRTDFYFADWGASLLAVHEVHPDPAFLEAAYGPLARYAHWLDDDRDAQRTGLYDVRDPYETGQENMSRYTAVDPAADQHHFQYRIRLKGVDLTVYAYRLRRALARVAAMLDRPEDVARHDAVADRIAEAVRTHMWDEKAGMFSDVDPATMQRTGVKAAVCFYPYMTDIVDASHLDGLRRNLFDPDAFWLPYPVPSTSADDPTFDADARWKGVRQSCTWNGRVWPMTNAHVIEALGRAASMDARLRRRAAELLERTIHMLFFDDDPARPNCFEHYSPLNGRPSIYRGIDDYQHSWINDLIIRFVAGFRTDDTGEGRVVLDPLPLDLDHLHLERLPFRGSLVTIKRTRERMALQVDGRLLVEGPIGEPLEVSL
ncbi:MAG: trehalase family glycosidase [Gemmatimonadota bacterium]